MNLDRPVSCRLATSEVADLKAIGEATGHNVSQLLRMGATELILRAKTGSRADELTVHVGVPQEHLRLLVETAEEFGMTLSAFVAQAALSVAEAVQAGGTARCGHATIGGVKNARCSACGGPMPMRYDIQLTA